MRTSLLVIAALFFSADAVKLSSIAIPPSSDPNCMVYRAQVQMLQDLREAFNRFL